MKFKESIKMGKLAEKRFICLCKNLNIKCVKSTDYEDIYEHFDYRIWINNVEYKIEVKAAKPKFRKDVDIDYDNQWIEYYKVIGKIGWILGKADYIAFELKNGFILIKREDIKNLVDFKMIGRDHEYGSDNYQWYRRPNRKDYSIYVPMLDLKTLKYKIYYDDFIKIGRMEYIKKSEFKLETV
jgi:hypothetical protein